MKLSEHIAKMQALLGERGDLDMACTTGSLTLDAENQAMAMLHIRVIEAIGQDSPSGISAPYVLIGGEGYDSGWPQGSESIRERE